MLGDDYQAVFFWTYAVKLFMEHTKLIKIEYEGNTKAFDDVIAYYSDARDEYGDQIFTDYFQVKYHVAQTGSFTLDSLLDPTFINAQTVSILQRAYQAQKQKAPNGIGARFIIVSPWVIHPDDVLSALTLNRAGAIKLDVLFDGKAKSHMAKIRRRLKDHLGITNDEELRQFLRSVRIWAAHQTFDQLVDTLNILLHASGFKLIDKNSMLNPYVNLIKQLKISGINQFDRDGLLKWCKNDALHLGFPLHKANNECELGIRSFYRRAEHMEDETESMLCLLSHFNGREINDPEHWKSKIYCELEAFLSSLSSQREYYLHLDCHYSIAFAAGNLLDSKSGLNVWPIQRGRGRSVWRAEQSPEKIYPMFTCEDTLLTNSGEEVVTVIQLTHDITPEVVSFSASERSINASKLVRMSFEPSLSTRAVEDGSHAWLLAEQVVKELKARRNEIQRRSRLHIFYSGPVSLLFFIGQLSRGLGTCILYEYNFETSGPYVKGITINN